MAKEQQFTTLLNNELSCLKTLLDTLEREFQVLNTSDVAALEQVTQEKNNALANQATATLSRQNFVTAADCENTNQGLQQLISSYQNQQALTASIDQLHSMAEQCQNANRTNGRLISQKQQQTRNVLDILRQADSKPSTYSGQGDTVTPTEGRILGKA